MLMPCAGIYVHCNFQNNKYVNKINTTTINKEYEKKLSYNDNKIDFIRKININRELFIY